MKQFVIWRDRKMGFLLLTYFLILFSYVLLINQSAYETTQIMDRTSVTIGFYRVMNLFEGGLLIFVYIRVMRRVVTFVYMDDQKIMTGVVFPKQIKLSDIIGVKIIQRLNIFSKNKNLKIIWHHSPQNDQAYKSISEGLAPYIEDGENGILAAEEGQLTDAYTKKWDGLLTLVLIGCLLDILNMSVYVEPENTFSNPILTLTSTAIIVVFIIFQVFSLLMLILRKKSAPRLILISRYIFMLILLISKMAFEVFNNTANHGIYLRLAFVFFYIGIVLYTVILQRYLKNSETVKKLFCR